MLIDVLQQLGFIIYTDNSNTVDIFSSLRVLPPYNHLLKTAINILNLGDSDMRVLHVPGVDNAIADALSRADFKHAIDLAPGLRISTFEPWLCPFHAGTYHLSTPSRNTGGEQIMIRGNRRARQPVREVWSREWLVHERAIALGHVIDQSTLSNYSSALNSYLNFVKLHDLLVEPTPETLSFYTVYMSHHINPRSVNTYLSGISQQLEDHFPTIKEA